MLLPGLTEILSSPTAIVNDLLATAKLMGMHAYTRQLMFRDANHFLDLYRVRDIANAIGPSKWVPKEYQARNWDMQSDRKYLVHGEAQYYFPGFEGFSTSFVSFYADRELSDEEYLEALQAEFDKKGLYSDGRLYVSFDRIGTIERNPSLT